MALRPVSRTSTLLRAPLCTLLPYLVLLFFFCRVLVDLETERASARLGTPSRGVLRLDPQTYTDRPTISSSGSSDLSGNGGDKGRQGSAGDLSEAGDPEKVEGSGSSGSLQGLGELRGSRQLQQARQDGGPADPLAGWKPSVPSVALRRGVAYEGDLLRLDRFLHKVVVERRPVTVVGLGSSCTSEFGGRKGPQLNLLNLDAFEVNRVVNADGWLSTALDTLVRAYPPREPKRWTNATTGVTLEEPYWLINLGIGAVGPEPWAACLGKTYFEQLPEEVDLIVVEWALAASEEGFLEGYDMVLQQLLHMWDPPPAILLVNFFFWCRGNLWCRNTTLENYEATPQLNMSWSTIGVFSFQSWDAKGTGDVSEDNITVLAQYYGLPSISMRNPFYTLAAQTREGYLLHDQIAEDDMGLHPGLHLARSRYADVIVHFFRRTIAGMAERRAASREEGAEAIEAALLEVPPPFFSRWSSDRFSTQQTQTQHCYTYETELGVEPPIRHLQGFHFTKDPDSKYPKPGLATWEEGATVEFELDTTPDMKMLRFPSSSSEVASRAQAQVELRYLVSYERMGGAALSCVEGCTCPPLQLEATCHEHWSVAQATVVDVTQSPKCVIRLVSTRSDKGAKFKILSLSVLFTPPPS